MPSLPVVWELEWCRLEWCRPVLQTMFFLACGTCSIWSLVHPRSPSPDETWPPHRGKAISTASMMWTSSRGTLQAGGCLHGSTTWQRDMKEHMPTMATPEGTVTQMEKHSEKLGISFTQNIHMLHPWVYLKQRASMRNKSQELHLIAHTSPPCWWLGRTLGGLSLTEKYSTGIFLYWKLCLSTWTNMSSEASALIFSEFI